MKTTDIENRVKEVLPESRFTHTLGVRDEAVRLAEQYNEDTYRIEVAALLHDYAKPLAKESLLNVLKEREPNENFSEFGGVLLHAPAGAYMIEREFKDVIDQDIFNAVYWHTTGHPDMSTFEKIIFLADFIEPGRHFPGVHEVRKAAEKGLDEAVTACFVSTISHLVENRRPVHPMTLAAYNSMLMTKPSRSE
ncbi:hydrolase [Geomicrobium sp. JCM 19037]|uniref:bis(5'-nucleosyl)-tetraphosphatase (symmetrical) YqeK n=1 Tax=unclassified Geomicrobium TaxID=2628951 RepID=UPI00045F1734|nr:bis(5'-nucleosyl)-tetraphosphatase (symmetrical) YqeK [Geomicrobium sp. JCM 19037]GAK04146.1 hydrolase [Geomicrobium sp. JCM 19037]